MTLAIHQLFMLGPSPETLLRELIIEGVAKNHGIPQDQIRVEHFLKHFLCIPNPTATTPTRQRERATTTLTTGRMVADWFVGVEKMMAGVMMVVEMGTTAWTGRGLEKMVVVGVKRGEDGGVVAGSVEKMRKVGCCG